MRQKGLCTKCVVEGSEYPCCVWFFTNKGEATYSVSVSGVNPQAKVILPYALLTTVVSDAPWRWLGVYHERTSDHRQTIRH